MLPSIFGENLFEDFFSDPFDMMVPQTRNVLYGKHGKNLMKTDVRETKAPMSWISTCPASRRTKSA